LPARLERADRRPRDLSCHEKLRFLNGTAYFFALNPSNRNFAADFHRGMRILNEVLLVLS
jgi:hypothetical protein